MDKNYFLSSPQFMIGMSFTYFSVIKGLQMHMKNRNAYSLKSIMQFYNIIQVLLNIYMLYGLYDLQFLAEKPNLLALNVPYSDKIAYFINIHYLSKYFDYLDTVFMILRNKNNQVSFLHVYHHTTVCFVWGYLVNIDHNNGTAAFVALLNSLVHVIMYSHYYITSLGYQNPFKKMITQIQLTQFILFMMHSSSVLIWENIYPRHLAFIELTYNFIMIILFGNFYMRNYNRRIATQKE